MQWGLRARSALALSLCVGVVLGFAGLAAWPVVRRVEERLGTAFVRNATQYNKQRILAPVLRELALAQRLADSQVTRRWLRHESDPAARSLFFAEAEGYRRAFTDHSYFVVSAACRNYYFNDARTAYSEAPRYQLKPTDPGDAWFFNTLRTTRDFNLNVDVNGKVGAVNVWFNVLVKDGGRTLGLAGTGLKLTSFVDRFVRSGDAGITPMILNRQGAIQAHPNRKLIDYASINHKAAASTLFRLLPDATDREAAQRALEQAARDANGIAVFHATMDGRPQLFAVSYIPELSWYVLTAVDVDAARVLDSHLWLPALLTGAALLCLLLLGVGVAVDRLLLAPLLRLTQGARQVAEGHYNVQLPRAGHDELGELTRAFATMTARVRSHADELESQVRDRTRELVAVNDQMAAANTKLGDSIRYASLIQNALLPERELARAFGDRCFVLWRPRDVVGGDYYVFRPGERGCLLGVLDCAGHGVPGAFMTMIARAALNAAVEARGIADPAALLLDMDQRWRSLLPTDDEHARLATHMDAGLVYVDFAARTLGYAGARISLYWCDGEEVGEVKGARRVVGGKPRAAFETTVVACNPHHTYYLTTDGLLDQAGGPRGFSFGEARFAELLRRHARRPLDEQREAFAAELDAYRGELPQRDDITVVGFRLGEGGAAGDGQG